MYQIDQVSKIYRRDGREVRALDEVSLQIEAGEFMVVRGASGSGKTTLLLALGGMLRPTKGRIVFDGQDLYALADAERARVRAEQIGFVFQMFHLVPYLSVRGNVLLPSAAGASAQDRGKADELLAALGLTERASHKPSELSAGERQRTALARALITSPKLILADEPTGNLDPDNAAIVLKHLKAFQQQGGTMVVVTHGTDADELADRVCRLNSGRIDTSS